MIFQYKDHKEDKFKGGEWLCPVLAEIEADGILEADKTFLEIEGLKKIPPYVGVAIVKEFTFDVDAQSFDPDKGTSIV